MKDYVKSFRVFHCSAGHQGRQHGLLELSFRVIRFCEKIEGASDSWKIEDCDESFRKSVRERLDT